MSAFRISIGFVVRGQQLESNGTNKDPMGRDIVVVVMDGRRRKYTRDASIHKIGAV